MYAGDDNDPWNDAGPCPACGEPDCWLGCPEADVDDDPVEYDHLIIDAADIEIGDTIAGHTVYDIAPSTAQPDHLIVAVALNGAASAYLLDITEQVEVTR